MTWHDKNSVIEILITRLQVNLILFLSAFVSLFKYEIIIELGISIKVRILITLLPQNDIDAENAKQYDIEPLLLSAMLG